MVGYCEEQSQLSEENMARTIKIILSVSAFLITSAIVAINFNTGISILAAIAASAALFYYIYTTDGLFTGYAESLNSNVGVATTNISQLIRASHRSIKIVSATLSPAIYCKPEVFKEMESAKDRGVEFEILIAGDSVQLKKVRPTDATNADNFFKFWQWVKDGEIKVNSFEGSPLPHFMVVDDLHVRIESKHKVCYYPDSRELKRRAKTHFLNETLALKYSDKFAKLKSQSHSYNTIH
jgi:hypothetical protein